MQKQDYEHPMQRGWQAQGSGGEREPAVLEEASVTAWLGRDRPARWQRLVHWRFPRSSRTFWPTVKS